jgi:N-acetylmuramoyl-L-alanine amidase
MKTFYKGISYLRITMLSMSLLFALPLANLADSNKLTKLNHNYDPIRTIVIDAGHGGKDTGCLGLELKEKDVALEIALRLGQKLQEYNPRIKIIFTRTDDRFIPLFERTAIANRNHADLFVSIHCNASANSSASGSETFVMGLHRSKENLEIAKRENKAVLLEDNYQANYGGYDPNSPEGHIILSMYQNHNLNTSISLAEQIEKSISNTGTKVSRGVKQAGFVVLRTATMPSILIETGFLTNSKEEQMLSDSEGRNQMAESIFEGLRKYIESQQEFNETVMNTVEEKTANPKQIKTIVKGENKTDLKPIIPKVTKAKEYVIIDQEEKQAPKPKVQDAEINYCVQIAALKNMVAVDKLTNQADLDIKIIKENGVYKYLSGMYPDLPQAYEHRKKLLELGLQGVFIFKFNGEKHHIVENSK